jgi:hypothetical protein
VIGEIAEGGECDGGTLHISSPCLRWQRQGWPDRWLVPPGDLKPASFWPGCDRSNPSRQREAYERPGRNHLGKSFVPDVLHLDAAVAPGQKEAIGAVGLTSDVNFGNPEGNTLPRHGLTGDVDFALVCKPQAAIKERRQWVTGWVAEHIEPAVEPGLRGDLTADHDHDILEMGRLEAQKRGSLQLPDVSDPVRGVQRMCAYIRR